MPFPPPGDIPEPEIESMSAALQANFFNAESPSLFSFRGSLFGPGSKQGLYVFSVGCIVVVEERRSFVWLNSPQFGSVGGMPVMLFSKLPFQSWGFVQT